jgi:hypothetical protein
MPTDLIILPDVPPIKGLCFRSIRGEQVVADNTR